jgi:hypothetical protein
VQGDLRYRAANQSTRCALFSTAGAMSPPRANSGLPKYNQQLM